MGRCHRQFCLFLCLFAGLLSTCCGFDPISRDDAIAEKHRACSTEVINQYICSAEEEKNLEDHKQSDECDMASTHFGCASGYFASKKNNRLFPTQCCPGYYCPFGFLCLFKCDKGAFCPSPNIDADMVDEIDIDVYGTPGSIENTPCEAGYYCPTLTEQIECPAGYYCREGDTKPHRCPWLTHCPAGTEAPTISVLGLVFDIFLMLILFIGNEVATHGYNCYVKTKEHRAARGLSVSGFIFWCIVGILTLCPTSVSTRYYFSSKKAQVQSEIQSYRKLGVPLVPLKIASPESSLRQGASGRYESLMEGSPERAVTIDPAEEDGEGGFIMVGDSSGEGLSGTTGAGWKRGGGLEGLRSKVQPMEVSFEGLGLELRLSKRTILENVTGSLQPGRLTAVMGPSGAGKTTFLNTLAGKAAAYGNMRGVIRVNGEPVSSLERFRKVMGFVPQEDIMHTVLTCRENLLFSSVLFGPENLSILEKSAIVDEVMDVLGIYDVRHSVIGDQETRGVSGGQRKRVNIGLEIVKDPTLLLLDEPTSGLDSSSSMDVMSALRVVASLGLTIAAVIHQPRAEVFRMFDEVLLLGKGGRTVFSGDREGIESYFSGLGFSKPRDCNVADFILDIVSGSIAPEGSSEAYDPSVLVEQWESHTRMSQGPSRNPVFDAGAATSNEEAQSSTFLEQGSPSPENRRDSAPPRYLAPLVNAVEGPARVARKVSSVWSELVDEAWRGGSRNSVGSRGSLDIAPLGGAHGASVGGMPDSLREQDMMGPFTVASLSDVSIARSSEFRDLQRLRRRQRAANRSCWRRVVIFISLAWTRVLEGAHPKLRTFSRHFVLCLWRSVLQQLRTVGLGLMDVFLVIFAAGVLGIVNLNVQLEEVIPTALMSSMAIFMAASVSALRNFGAERTVFWRESAGGLNRLAYFLAKNLGATIMNLLSPLAFLVTYYQYAGPRGHFIEYLWTMIVLYFAGSGLGYLVSLLFHPQKAQLNCNIVSLSLAMVAGSSPTLKQLDESGLHGKVLPNLSYARWGVEALTVVELRSYSKLWKRKVDDLMEEHWFHFDNFGSCLGWLVLMGLAFRVAAFFALIGMNRDKQR